MPSTHIIRTTPVIKTARLTQLEGIFDIPPTDRSTEEWQIDFDLPEEWNVGVFVGPSGCGKTTIANELFPENIIREWAWSENKSLIDDFPSEMSIKEITSLLSSVGFSSPPSWLRPYRVLSNGEQFRCHMARTLAECLELSVVDEFTSVVDRTVAQVGSFAIQKTVRKRNQKLIVLTCHYDVLDWLEPDWVFQPHINRLYAGRSLHQRPKIELSVRRVHHSAWKLFGKYHYLDDKLNTSARCYCAFIDDVPVAFCAVISFPHAQRPGWRFHRLVCLPDYQGVGIGGVLADYVGSIFKATGKPVFRTLAHPAVIHAANKSPNWKMKRKPSRTANFGKHSAGDKMIALKDTLATKRLTAGFEYVGEAMNKLDADRLLYD